MAPKDGGVKRDFELARAKILSEDGFEATCHPGVACSTCWTVTSEKKTVARFLVYVDDVVISGPIKWVRAVMNMVQTLWPVKVTGIMSKTPDKGLPETLFVNKMNFLGITIEMSEDGTLEMHQHQYLVTKLRDRNMLAGKGKNTLPMPCEGKLVPEIKDKSFEIRKKDAQKEVGTLMWAALKSRPDVAVSVSIAASQVAHNPTEALRMTAGIWKYLACTVEERMIYEPKARTDERMILNISTDASHSPGGNVSRTGVVVTLNEKVIHWATNRQSCTTLSSCESEILAHLTGFKLMIGIRDLIEETWINPEVELEGDNLAAIQTLTNEITSWRNRHYSMKATWLRDKIKEFDVILRHKYGSLLTSDALTKVLTREKLIVARSRLNLRAKIQESKTQEEPDTQVQGSGGA